VSTPPAHRADQRRRSQSRSILGAGLVRERRRSGCFSRPLPTGGTGWHAGCLYYNQYTCIRYHHRVPVGFAADSFSDPHPLYLLFPPTVSVWRG